MAYDAGSGVLGCGRLRGGRGSLAAGQDAPQLGHRGRRHEQDPVQTGRRRLRKPGRSLNCCCRLKHTDPGLDLTGSGAALLVGVVATQGNGDLGVPGVFKVGVVGTGDMGLEPTS